MLKRLLLALSCLGLCGQVFASNTVITDPDSVAPFNLCFTDDMGEWPAAENNPLSLLAPSQSIPFCLNQNLTVEQYKALSIFEKDVFVAVSMWQSYFNSQHPITIRVAVDVSAPRSEGGPAPGKVEHQLLNGSEGRMTVVYPSALTTMLGQSDSDQPDIKIGFHPIENQGVDAIPHCYDQTPTKPNRQCLEKQDRDITTIMLHELGHGYGISSTRIRRNTSKYGNFRNHHINAFDYQTNNGNGYDDLTNNYADYFADHQHPILFTGDSTVNYLKSQGLPWPIPICNLTSDEHEFSQNFSHFCFTSCTNPDPKQDQPDLMGMWCLWKINQLPRLSITDLDLHVLYDIGYAPVLKTTTAVPDIREKLFNPAA